MCHVAHCNSYRRISLREPLHEAAPSETTRYKLIRREPPRSLATHSPCPPAPAHPRLLAGRDVPPPLAAARRRRPHLHPRPPRVRRRVVPTSDTPPQPPPRLDLTFDDVEVPAPDDLLSLLPAPSRPRWAEQNGLSEVPPTPSDAAAINAFARSLALTDRTAPGVLLCHCGAGMSRAPAAALICLATWHGPGTEAECVQHIRRLRPGAAPHLGLVRFADQLLARNCRLTSATEAASR
jgi:predicted protein tyrosine phosphatase